MILKNNAPGGRGEAIQESAVIREIRGCLLLGLLKKQVPFDKLSRSYTSKSLRINGI